MSLVSARHGLRTPKVWVAYVLDEMVSKVIRYVTARLDLILRHNHHHEVLIGTYHTGAHVPYALDAKLCTFGDEFLLAKMYASSIATFDSRHSRVSAPPATKVCQNLPCYYLLWLGHF